MKTSPTSHERFHHMARRYNWETGYDSYRASVAARNAVRWAKVALGCAQTDEERARWAGNVAMWEKTSAHAASLLG